MKIRQKKKKKDVTTVADLKSADTINVAETCRTCVIYIKNDLSIAGTIVENTPKNHISH